MYKHPLVDREKMTPQEAFQILLEGNDRFIKNLSAHRDLLNIVNLTKNEQKPFAAILGCSDSRTSSELIFDQGLGDIFSVRLAGNVTSRKAIASIEYSCKYLGSKLVVVLGHTNCGAVKAACDNFSEGIIGELVADIRPAVLEKNEYPESQRTSQNLSFVNHVCASNINLQMNNIIKTSTILPQMLEKKEIGMVGGLYNIETGKVDFNLETAIF
jgi:carbonic anhydrase